MIKNRYLSLSVPEKRILWTTLGIAIFFTLFATTVFDTLVNAPNLQYRFANSVPFVITLIALASAVLILNGKTTSGVWLLQLGSLALLIANTTQAEGFGFPSALILIAITLYVPFVVLPGNVASASMGIGLLGAVIIVLVDTFWSGTRVPALSQDVTTATILSVVLAAFLIGTTVVRFNSYVFRTKLIIAFGLIALIPLVILGYQNIIVTQNILTNESKSNLTSLSDQAASRIDTYLKIQEEEIRIQAKEPVLINYLKLNFFERSGSPEETAALGTLLAYAQKDRGVFVRSIALLDAFGNNLLDTSNTNIGRNESSFDYFTKPVETNLPYLSNIIFKKSNEGSIYFSAPVEDERGTIVGVLRAEYATGIIQDQLEFQTSGYFIAVIDPETFLRVANTDRLDTLPKTFKNFTGQELFTLQAEGRLPQGSQDILYIPAEQFVRGVQNLSKVRSFTAQSPFLQEDALTTGTLLTSEPWYVIAGQSQSSLLAPIKEQSKTSVVISLVILLVASIAAFFAAQILTRPISMLTNVAEKITRGDLGTRAAIDTPDEIGMLANAFNRMTSQLQDTLNGLERRVAERSADLEMARQLSERRAQELHAISEISRAISSEQRLNILLPLVTRLVSERFDFYHIGIFFIDDTRQYAVLQAANSEGGKRMIERGHQLEVGQTGIVGNVAQTGKPRIALDVGSDAVFFNNPDLPNTRSEMALPLNIRSATIGVLDVQSTRPGAFTEADANTLSILADQVAIAIENARLFGQTQHALDEVQKLYRQIQSQEWTEFIQQSEHVGYRQSVIGGRPLETLVETEEIRKALQQGQVVLLANGGDKSQPIIAVPVKLRGQTIGVLNIKAPKRKTKWNQDEVGLVQAVSDRLALALENARLLQESQRRAAKEQKIGEMTAKIGASINLRNVLQTAVEELGRALPGSEVVIQFNSTQEN